MKNTIEELKRQSDKFFEWLSIYKVMTKEYFGKLEGYQMNVLKEEYNKYRANIVLKIGITHGGSFHADDVFSTALLKIIYPKIVIERVFSVTDEMKNDEDSIIYDIGYGRFDHHQADKAIRENGTPYAAFGLLWREFGHKLLSDENAIKKFDEDFIQILDIADNTGEYNQLASIIGTFNPSWDDDEQADNLFLKAVDFAKTILERSFKKTNSSIKAKSKVQYALDNSKDKIVVLDKHMPYNSALIPSDALYVIYPSLRGGYNAQTIKKEFRSIVDKLSFPEEWLDENNRPKSITFFHTGRFMTVSNTLEEAYAICLESIKVNQSKIDCEFNNFDFLQSVADDITAQTNVENTYSLNDGDSEIFDFDIGYSYMTNKGKTALFFAYVTSDGKTLSECSCTDRELFIEEAVAIISRFARKN